MSHIITPKKKILDPDEYHCCKGTLGGRTPTEYTLSVGEDQPTELVEHVSGDVYTTTWTTMTGGTTSGGTLYFTICCKAVATINWSSWDTGGFGEVFVDGVNLFNFETESGSYELLKPELDPGPCGVDVSIMWSEQVSPFIVSIDL